MQTFKLNRGAMLAMAAMLAIAGCKGSKGDPGAPGTNGTNGTNGTPGVQGPPGAQGEPGAQGPGGLGTVTVTVKFASVNGTAITPALPAPGVYCFTNPDFTGNTADLVAEATTDAKGNAVFELPGGSYKFQCRGGADYTDNMAMTGDVALAAGGTASVAVTADRKNPLYFTTAPSFGATPKPGDQVTINTGATSVSGATITVEPLTSVTGSLPTLTSNAFTVDGLDAILKGLDSGDAGLGGNGKFKAFRLPRVPGFAWVGTGVLNSLNGRGSYGYTFKVTATSGANTTSVVLGVPVGGLQVTQGLSTGPIGVMAIADGGAAASYSWTAAGPNGAVTLNGASTRNPWFVPTAEGTYTLTNGTTVLTYTASSYAGVAGCGCHNKHATDLGYASIEDLWSREMGLHGNHNYFSNPASRLPGAPGAESILEWGLKGVDYSTTCYTCHSNGSFTTSTVDNGGFRTTMMKLDNAGTYDPTKGPTQNAAWKGDGVDHWTGLDASLKKQRGIQCEDCHGPASEHQGSGGDVAKISLPWSVGACAACHDSPSHHDKVELWGLSLHNNSLGARGEGAANTDCARCHTAQGFAQMAANINANGDAGFANLTAIPAGQGMPQTCSACHNAHSTELRLMDDVKAAPDGYSFSGVGAGAVCIGCHVARGAAPQTGAVGTPHHGPQADILFGINAYFVSGINVSKHAAVGDTCVGCHVKLVPASVATGNDNHTFRADDSICKNCHGATVNGEATKSAVVAGLESVMSKLEGNLLAALQAEYTANNSFFVGTTQVTAAPTAVVQNGESHGQLLWIVTAGGTDYSNTIGNFFKADGTTLVIPADGVFAKALWNYLLIEGDKSEGIHNPTFVIDVINATNAQL